MKPPFHLRKSENSTMLRDTYDFDFVKRAYAMLRVGGVLMAIIGQSWSTLKPKKDEKDEKDRTLWIKKI